MITEKTLKYAFYLLMSVILILLIVFGVNILIPVKSDQIALRVKPGITATTIASQLREKGIIRSAGMFTVLAKLRNTDRNLIAGTYTLGGRHNLLQTLKMLEEGHTSAVRITFPEGLSLQATLERIDKSGLASYAALDSLASDPAVVYELTGIKAPTLEGFLYPETYAFDISLSPLEILRTMVVQFGSRLQKAGIDIRHLPDFYPKLILASIVERESGPVDERKLVAGVLYNRLQKQMPLESCATVDYILEKQGVHRRVLTLQDTEIPSPYNTYIDDKLPPGPICNPSLSSIEAALHPAQTDYLFFVADRNGRNVFSITGEKHFRKIEKYRRKDW